MVLSTTCASIFPITSLEVSNFPEQHLLILIFSNKTMFHLISLIVTFFALNISQPKHGTRHHKTLLIQVLRSLTDKQVPRQSLGFEPRFNKYSNKCEKLNRCLSKCQTGCKLMTRYA